jgi:hypothetical protein
MSYKRGLRRIKQTAARYERNKIRKQTGKQDHIMDPMERQTVIEHLSGMSESEFLDCVAQARGKHNPQAAKEAAASALRQWIGSPVRSD